MRASASEAAPLPVRLPIAALAVIALLAAPCHALRLPESATSRSVQVPSLLLEDPVNGFLFPQTRYRGAGEIGTFGSASAVAEGVGARVAFGEHAFRYDLWSGVPTVSSSIAEFPAFQAGWSTTIDGTDVGVAYAWANEADKLRRQEGGWRGSATESDRRYFEQAHLRRISLGVGRGGDRARIDLAFSLQREALQYDSFYEFRRPDGPVYQHETRAYRVGEDYRPGGSLRAAWRVTRRERLLGFVTFQETTQDFSVSGRREINGPEPSVTEETTDTSWGKEWSCGLALEGALPRRGRWLAHASYVTEGDRWRYGLNPAGWRRSSDERETFRIGVAGWMTVPAGLELRAGVSAGVLRQVERRYNPGDVTENRVERRDRSVHSFGWGVARSFETFDLVAALNMPPKPWSPIARLDIRLRL